MSPSSDRGGAPERTETLPRQAVVAAIEELGPGIRALARYLQTGVAVLDASGAAMFANRAAMELLGITADGGQDEALARLCELVPERLRDASSSGVEDRDEIDVDLGPPEGRRRILLRALPIEDGACGALLLIEDQSRMAALDASLALAGRMQTGSLLRSQVHDLKAPLNALALNLDLLRRSLSDEDDKREDVREEQLATTKLLAGEVKRLGRSLDRFLRESMPAAPSKRGRRRLDARRPVREVARLIRPTADRSGIRVRSELPEEAVHVFADADTLKQALLNLVLNGLEAQPNGGELRLRVERGSGSASISIEDDGPGIPESLLEKVLEMNFTTKPGGNGIGLTVARSLVHGIGGRLELECPPGGGTTARIHLSEREG